MSGCCTQINDLWYSACTSQEQYLSICLNKEIDYLCFMDNNSCIRLFADLQQIRKCKASLKAAQKSFMSLSAVLALAGNEVRLKMLYLLEAEKELCPCDLADILGMSIPAVSQHLRKLKDGSVVQTRKEGQTIYYSITQHKLKVVKPFFKHIDIDTQKLATI